MSSSFSRCFLFSLNICMKHQSSPLNKNLFSIFIKIIGWLTIQCNRTVLVFKKVTNTKKILYKKNSKENKNPVLFFIPLE